MNEESNNTAGDAAVSAAMPFDGSVDDDLADFVFRPAARQNDRQPSQKKARLPEARSLPPCVFPSLRLGVKRKSALTGRFENKLKHLKPQEITPKCAPESKPSPSRYKSL